MLEMFHRITAKRTLSDGRKFLIFIFELTTYLIKIERAECSPSQYNDSLHNRKG